MTPAARVAAAIGILDDILGGAPAEKILTGWARANRYAGSGDRAAIRDHVFDALRCRRSFAWVGGAETGRGLMLGALRLAGRDPAELFTGARYAPDPVTSEEAGRDLAGAPEAVRLDLPDWLWPLMRDSLGDDLAPVAGLLRRRAPVFLRVNMARATRDQALAALAGDQIETVPHDLSATALEVTQNPRRVQQSKAFLDGLVELQDAASQAVIDLLPQGGRVLDYCAGGGGKALALAARGADVVAHDADPRRMRDIPIRAARAGVTIRTAQTADLPGLAPFDLVLCDAPCSGSGAWRRSPDGKWALTPERLGALCETQAAILLKAARLVGPGGKLAYATCSVLMAENGAQIQGFLARQSGWQLDFERQFSPLEGGDGFFACCLTRAEKQS